MINLLKIFNRTMVSTKGKELLPHHQFPVRRLWCYVPPCAAIVPLHVLNEVRIITVQERGSANFMPLVGPSLNMDSMFCLLVEGQSTYPRQVELVASSQIDGRPVRDDARPLSKSKSMAPWPPNMLPGSAICRQGAQHMRVPLPYNLHKWIMFVIMRHHTNLRLCL